MEIEKIGDLIDHVWPHEDYRMFQKDIVIRGLSELIVDDKRAYIVSAPVGSGKSPVCYTLSRLIPLLMSAEGDTLDQMARSIGEREDIEDTPYKGYYITPQIILQDQLQEDYSDIMGVIKGRSNYSCRNHEGHDCESGPCRWKDTEECKGFKVEKAKALNQNVTNTNFSMFITDSTLEHRGSLVIDEAHNMDSYLLGQVSIQLREDRLRDMGWNIPNFDEYERYVGWMEDKLKELNSTITSIKRRLKRQANMEGDVDDGLVKRHDKLQRLAGKMGRLVQDWEKTEEPWVVSHDDFYHQRKGIQLEKVVFKPITPYRFMESMVFSKGTKVVISSATPPSHELLGLEDDEVHKKNVPSNFPVENRPVFYRPVGKMSKDYREKNIDKVVDVILQYAEGKSLIHCRSYQFAKMLKEEMEKHEGPRDNIVLQDRKFREDSLETWEASDDKYFLSVNMWDGIDLKGEKCRSNFIPIVPFPFLGDDQIQKRLDVEGHKFYNWLTAMRIQQGVGRSTRSKDDYSDSYILDGNFKWFYKQNKKYFENWFKEALVGI